MVGAKLLSGMAGTKPERDSTIPPPRSILEPHTTRPFIRRRPQLRRLAPFLLAIVILLLPAVAPAASAAGAELTYQTPNGQRTLVQMGDELMSVGYGGPWDTQSVINAYAQTTGGQVQVIGVITGQAPPLPSSGPSPSSTPLSNSAGRRTIILEIGGANSSPGGWLALESTLRVEGYTSADFYSFSYGGWSVAQGSSTMILNDYTSAQTCAKIDDSIRLLAGMLRFLRDNQWAAHVVLVGHSVGGIVALGVVTENPDLAGSFAKSSRLTRRWAVSAPAVSDSTTFGTGVAQLSIS